MKPKAQYRTACFRTENYTKEYYTEYYGLVPCEGFKNLSRIIKNSILKKQVITIQHKTLKSFTGRKSKKTKGQYKTT